MPDPVIPQKASGVPDTMGRPGVYACKLDCPGGMDMAALTVAARHLPQRCLEVERVFLGVSVRPFVAEDFKPPADGGPVLIFDMRRI